MEHSSDRAGGGSVNSPPWFDGGCGKYTEWKIYMKSYFYAQDEHGRMKRWMTLMGEFSRSLVGVGVDKIVKKILRALPEKFHSKVTSIEDSFDIDDYPLDELIRNLKTYEMRKHGNSNNKSLLLTWSDDETQEVENVVFVSSLLADSESDEAFSDDETAIRCKQLYKTTWEQERNRFTDELTSVSNDKVLPAWKNERLELNNKIKLLELEDELKITQEKFAKFDISSSVVSRLFGSGKAPHDTFRLGYSGGSSKSTKFVKESRPVVENGESCTDIVKKVKDKGNEQLKYAQQVKFDQGVTTSQNRYLNSKTFIPTCHHCGKIGHIRPRCNERTVKLQHDQEKCTVESLQSELREQKELINRLTELFSKKQTIRGKNVWTRKSRNNSSLTHTDTANAACLIICVNPCKKSIYIEATCLVALTALADKQRDIWYVDSGCSRHMTGDKAWFSSFEDECTTGSVTFGNGRKAIILARGTVNTPGILNLKNILYVEGLIANLISVSHLSDDYEDVT
ncbi:uncharacterized protein LOC112178472 [Rosa chinensis]|uniref:uncharacterized protein LOC112178472 n=1 Tax=Rosa chinensis TaxID=74649 RepID=UPI000D08A358|nr:uncharacterized protein LOC112178472 [Rosa chinensis]